MLAELSKKAFPLKRIIKALAPTFLREYVAARKALSSVSNQPWVDACSGAKRIALERSRLSILPPTLHPLSFVIDVGGNEGQWSASVLELLPIPEIWIFEPNSEAMKICQERIGSRPGVNYFDLALGDTDGQAQLHVTASSALASILEPRGDFLRTHYGTNAARIVLDKQVQISTLDSLVPESRCVDLLKIDVQGFERAVLSGAQRVLRNTRAVLVEVILQSHYRGDETLPALWKQLENEGFSFWSLSPPVTGSDGKALWADAVFVKADDSLRAVQENRLPGRRAELGTQTVGFDLR
jgi:FkbM family methyltransferase